jgi:diguanylate cyclase (GGDEF)-like protein
MAQLTLLKQSKRLEGLLHDVQERTQLLNQLSHRVPGVIYQFRRYPDGRSCFPYASGRMWDMYEVHPEEALHDAACVIARIHPQDLEAVLESIEISATELTPWRHEYRVVLPQQGTRWRFGDAVPERLPDGSVLWHGFITDITERRLHQERTHRLAYYDPLTGLPNRRLLIDRLERELAHLRRCGRLGALLFIDLDNFKQINDARGHAVGDELLRQVAQRLSSVLRQDDTVARLGGDEFVVQVGNLDPDPDVAARQARLVAEKVRGVMEGRYEVSGFPYSSTGSIGLTLFPRGEATTVDDLLREADTAMYRAKSGGRNRIEFFEAKMQSEVEERLALEQDLQLAMAGNQFDVHVQPQVDAQGRIVGGELLMRWQHPQRGNVPPNLFIPLAEESTLILQIGQMVLQRACEALARLQQAGRQWTLSVNVSPRQFRSPDFVECVAHVLKETGADARGLILEVTEGLLIENWQDAVSRMSELVALGLRFSIDVFGTGYSSLVYLKKLPLYELKIDRTFVRDTPQDPNDTAIVEAILSVSRHLGLRVVAEGVETGEQAAFLTSHGCHCLQGFYFARPTPLAAWLDDVMA